MRSVARVYQLQKYVLEDALRDSQLLCLPWTNIHNKLDMRLGN